MFICLAGCGKGFQARKEVPARKQPSISAESLYTDAYQKLQRGELDAALKALDRGRPVAVEPSWSHKLIILRAEILLGQGRQKDALALVRADSPSEPAVGEFAVRKKLIFARGECSSGRFAGAETLLKEAEHLVTDGAPQWKGEVLLIRGTCSWSQKHLHQAERYFHEALDFARGHQQRFLEANASGSLGLVAMHNQQYDKAVDWFSAALDLARRLNARRTEEKTLGNLGLCDFELGDYQKAIYESTKAEGMARELGIADDQRRWSTDLGNAYRQVENLSEAERFYLQSLSLAQRLEDQQSIKDSLHNLAQFELGRKGSGKAEEYNQKALAIEKADLSHPPDFDTRLTSAEIALARKELPKATALLRGILSLPRIPVWIRWRAQSVLAKIYAVQDKPALADKAFRAAMHTVKTARSKVLRDEHKLAFLDASYFDDHIHFLIGQKKIWEALQIADFGRARTLAEGLGVARKTYSPDIQLSTVQRLLKQREQVMLEYWLGPDESLLWVIAPSGIKLLRLPSKQKIDRKVEDYNKGLQGFQASGRRNRNGQELYELLVQPAEKLLAQSAKVVIVPDGSLNKLNFETLLVPGTQTHYWIDEVEIENASSFALFANSIRRAPERFSTLLLIGNPVQASKQYPVLAHAQSEVKLVAEHFASGSRILIDGAKAEPSAYRKSRPERFEVIHFVTHGTASQISPLDSAIILSPEGVDSYKLYARDILGIKIHAGLVAISGCYGAGVRTYSSEGLVGLAWGFMRAGAHHVIAGLWEVDDNSTPQLMNHFYTALAKTNNPASALRSAKRDMLHSNSIYKKPYYWASLQLYTGS